MSTKTTNIGLVKPTTSEYANVTVLNENMDKIDAYVGNLKKDTETSISGIKADISALDKYYDYLKIVESAKGSIASVPDASNAPFESLTIYGKSIQDGTPTPSAPIDIVTAGSDGSIKLTKCGKNLFDITAKTQTLNGVTFSVNADKTITVNGTATAKTYFEVGILYCDNTEDYIFSGCPSGGSASSYSLIIQQRKGSTNTMTQYEIGTGANNASGHNTDNFRLLICIASGTTVSNLVFKPMVRLYSETDSTYEPYTGTTINFSTPNGLASVGDVCDTLELRADGTGELTKRLKALILNGSEIWYSGASPNVYTMTLTDVFNTNVGVCSHFDFASVPPTSENRKGKCYIQKTANGTCYFYVGYDDGAGGVDNFKTWLGSNPITLICELATPIVTELSAEEVSAFLALTSNKGITNVFTDDIAEVGIEYVADAKLYIDKKLAEL